MKVGEIRVIPKGCFVWSVSLQENVCFDKDITVKITNLIHGNRESCFGMIQLEFFKFTFPGMVDKTNGDISFIYSITKKHE